MGSPGPLSTRGLLQVEDHMDAHVSPLPAPPRKPEERRADAWGHPLSSGGWGALGRAAWGQGGQEIPSQEGCSLCGPPPASSTFSAVVKDKADGKKGAQQVLGDIRDGLRDTQLPPNLVSLGDKHLLPHEREHEINGVLCKLRGVSF